MLKGKTALVTGSTSGIGLGIARALAQQGVNIVLNGFGDAKGPQAEIEALGVASAYHGADMSKLSEIEDMMKFAASKFGRVDVLVNNAGIQHVAKVEDFPVEKWDAVIAINLTSAFHTTRLAIPAMREANWGRVINIASAHGVTCNAICPGWVLTPLVQKQIDDRAAREGISVAQAQIDLLSEKQPSLQFTTVDQLGGLAVFLCSPAADQVRGVAWQMDGGWTAQ
ncbi:MAG: 3-hydroxybutyrate dehydrogenase [Variovorax paradoxus]|uniref:3-hydroxybutyrate dehydrogenase n=1 Tax=Variovorax paradoxus TaxID=34073 RepID=A0A2W5P0C1_VARPD|nr:MAG: 3-hydroxybutyrate dehydrogenase [Variovorax paradoxus]